MTATELFSEDRSAEVVGASFDKTADPRLREIMTALVRHLHAFVKDVEPTDDEWATGDRVPHPDRADVRRRTSGVHPALRRARACRCWSRRSTTAAGDATESTVLGPFHMVDSPPRELGDEHRPGRQGRAVPGHRAGHRRRRHTAGRAPRSTCGRPTTTASTTCSSPACSRNATCAGCSPPTPTARSGSARSCPGTTRSRTTGRSASCWRPPDGIRTGRRTCTSSSGAQGYARWSPTCSSRTPPTSTRTRCSGSRRASCGSSRWSTTPPGPRARRAQPVPHRPLRRRPAPGGGLMSALLSFTYQALPMRVVLGAGAIRSLPDEIDRLGLRRALVLCSPEQAETGRLVAAALGDRSAGVLAEARMHVPVEVADRGPRPGPRAGRRRLRRGRRRVGHRAGQGDRARTRAADHRRADHLRRLGDDPGLGADRGRAEAHRPRPAGAAGERDLRPRAHPHPARRACR